MYRTFLALSLAALALPLAACSAAPYHEDAQQGGTTRSATTAGAFGGQGGSAAAQGAGATCADACSHYLTCRGAETSANLAKCLPACEQLGLTENQLASFVATDCATAIQAVEGPRPSSSSSSGGAGSQCNGCGNDGSGNCVWASQSDWGAGPYSGAVGSACDPSCCGM